MPLINKSNSLRRKPVKAKSTHDKSSWSSNGETRYNTRRWKRARLAFLRRNPACVHCQGRGVMKAANVVDHIIPASTGHDFWDQDNWQPLCSSCHNSKTGREGAKSLHSKKRKK